MNQQQHKRPRREAAVSLRFRVEVEVPSAYVCPISWRIMTDPVLDPDDAEGHAVDREAFEQHQRQYGVRPFTGLPPLPVVSTLGSLQQAIDLLLGAEDEGEDDVLQPAAKCLRLHDAAGPSGPRCNALGAAAAAVAAAVAAMPRRALSLKDCMIPPSFFCPLSGVLMLDPAVDKRNPEASLERAALEAHVVAYGTNPLTGERMARSDISTDRHLRSAISMWIKRRWGPQLPLHTTAIADAGGDNAAAEETAATTAAAGAASAGTAAGGTAVAVNTADLAAPAAAAAAVAAAPAAPASSPQPQREAMPAGPALQQTPPGMQLHTTPLPASAAAAVTTDQRLQPDALTVLRSGSAAAKPPGEDADGGQAAGAGAGAEGVQGHATPEPAQQQQLSSGVARNGVSDREHQLHLQHLQRLRQQDIYLQRVQQERQRQQLERRQPQFQQQQA